MIAIIRMVNNQEIKVEGPIVNKLKRHFSDHHGDYIEDMSWLCIPHKKLNMKYAVSIEFKEGIGMKGIKKNKPDTPRPDPPQFIKTNKTNNAQMKIAQMISEKNNNCLQASNRGNQRLAENYANVALGLELALLTMKGED